MKKVAFLILSWFVLIISVSANAAAYDIELVKWLKGEYNIDYFQEYGFILEKPYSFTVSENGKYSIYVKNIQGGEAVSVVEVTNVDHIIPAISITIDRFAAGAATVLIKVTDNESGVNIVKWLSGRSELANIRNNGVTLAAPYRFTVSKSGYYSIYANDIAGNESISIVEVNVDAPRKSYRFGSTVVVDNIGKKFTHADYLALFKEYFPNGLDMDAAITRAETAVLFTEMFALEDFKDVINFNDVEEKQWYFNAVDRISQKGIMIGYPDGSFKPGEIISRAETAAVITRAMKYENSVDVEFKDVDVEHWAMEYLKKVVANGIMIGDEEGTFRMDDGIKRSEMVFVINRLRGYK